LALIAAEKIDDGYRVQLVEVACVNASLAEQHDFACKSIRH
jgi:hypothetical protein